jgi:hypothetical protein
MQVATKMHNGISENSVAGVIVSVAVAITGFWFAIAATLYRKFIEPEHKRLEAALESEKHHCAVRIGQLEERARMLEQMWLLHAPQQLRGEMQGALAELALKVREREGGEA